MPTPHDGEAIVLGAGFSRAINSHMPVADRLGEQAYALAIQRSSELRSAALPSFSADYPFETWLSLLAQDLPYLREAENRQNAATFATLRDAIADALDSAQDESLRCEPPDWFYTLLGALHHLRADVVTFNYDTLVEAGVESLYLGTAGSTPQLDPDRVRVGVGVGVTQPRISSWDILRGQPPIPPAFYGSRSEAADTFRLLKLHGSLDWWQVPTDTSGATMSRSPVVASFGDPARLSEDDRRRYLPARERFIVPPLAVKSGYYSNPITRQLWQDADEALRRARRIALVGYSLPITDTVTSGLLARALADRDDVTVEVVNPHADDVAERITALGGPDEGSSRLVLTSTVADYTRQLADRCQQRVTDTLRALRPPPTHPGTIILTWATGIQPRTATIRHMAAIDGGTIELIPDETGSANTTAIDSQPTVVDLLTQSRQARRLTARVDGTLMPIVGITVTDFDNPSIHHPIFRPRRRTPTAALSGNRAGSAK